MPKKTTILILLLAIVTGALVFFAIISESQKEPQKETTVVPKERVVEKTARVFFSPQNIDISIASPASVQTVDLMVDTGGADITGVQAEAQFDPKTIVNVSLSPTVEVNSFFGGTAIVLFNEVNLETGRISYAITIARDQNPKVGVGKIATIYFQKAFNAPPTTTISFLNKTLVTKLDENESILKETAPLTITLSSGAQPILTPGATGPIITP